MPERGRNSNHNNSDQERKKTHDGRQAKQRPGKIKTGKGRVLASITQNLEINKQPRQDQQDEEINCPHVLPPITRPIKNCKVHTPPICRDVLRGDKIWRARDLRIMTELLGMPELVRPEKHWLVQVPVVSN